MVSLTIRRICCVVISEVGVFKYVFIRQRYGISPTKINLFIWRKGRIFVLRSRPSAGVYKQPTSDSFRDRLSPPVLHSRFEQYKGPTIYLHNQIKLSTCQQKIKLHMRNLWTTMSSRSPRKCS